MKATLPIFTAPPFVESWLSRSYRPEALKIDYICKYLKMAASSSAASSPKFRAKIVAALQSDLVGYLTSDLFNARLLLYLPFWAMKDPTPEFRTAVRNAWRVLLCHRDVRENFVRGDVYEEGARPSPPVGVIKVLHLTPWLLDYGYLTVDDLKTLIEQQWPRPCVMESLFDTTRYLCAHHILSDAEIMELGGIAGLPKPRERQQPLYVTEERQKWLDEQMRRPQVVFGNLINFSENLSTLDPEEIYQSYPRDHILCVGGSRIKGYAHSGSDLDIIDISAGNYLSPDPEMAGFIFNSVWMGQDAEAVIREQERHAKIYLALPESHLSRLRSLEKLERDLLQYRLMHKGFPYAYSDLSPATRDFPEMDGESAFYDDRYRLVATELFLRYVYLPFIPASEHISTGDRELQETSKNRVAVS